ncbi:bifunctional 4-hydroxy-2-oxoglutarate aldolase/2-dehydro-3-deoxy-phosphogluconate aldolase [Plantibacter sp. YIM 135347]|uniref:bifunctional 4-hydroxy-2-oxoglutarate aldolase/2-dehydro-3-deoxy-phosphogluconate aldolase n=1 Tax=Plantibacter sp. YIM 135347 TaxID=3423919 RepID=UPI003D33B4FC
MDALERPPISPALLEDGLLAIVRSTTVADAVRRGVALAVGGVRVLEVSYTLAEAGDAIRELRRELPEGVEIGAGTVTTPAILEAATAAGAEFFVSPNRAKRAVRSTRGTDRAFYPGAVTPSEILQSWNDGAAAVKVFPAGPFGPDYLSLVRDPLPHIPLIAVGGVTVATAASYLRSGAVAVGIGGGLNIEPARLEDLLAELRAIRAERLQRDTDRRRSDRIQATS